MENKTPEPTPETTAMFVRFLENQERRDLCCRLMEEFLVNLAEVFPECKKTVTQLDHFRTRVLVSDDLKHQFVKEWHRVMRPLYELADAKDNAFWASTQNLPVIGCIHLQQKFNDPGLTDESRRSMWEFIDRLNRLTRIYNAVPTNMLNHLERTATEVVSRIQNENGDMNPGWDWNELKELGKNAMENIHEDDLKEFVDNIKGLARNIQAQNITDITKIMTEIPGVSDMLEQSPEVSHIMNQLFTEENMNGIMDTMSGFMERMQQFNAP